VYGVYLTSVYDVNRVVKEDVAMSKERTVVDLEAAIETAREMMSTQGESALSMRRLAELLAISPMAIYRHVTDRDELIDLVMDRALADCIPPAQPDSPWQEQLVAYFEAFWTVMTDEPGLGAIAITRPLQGPNMGRITDDLLRICRQANHPDSAFGIIDALLLYTLGAIAYDISRPSTARKGIATGLDTPDLAARQDDYGQRDPRDYFRGGIQTVMIGLDSRITRGDLPTR
jgi:AcrR family transcriptional regulator